MDRFQTRGPQFGICSACGNSGKLSEDHTPPKSVPRIGQAALMRLAEAINATTLPSTSRHFQNGVKFRSLCENCNSVKLGGEYDPHLVGLTKTIDLHLQRSLLTPFRADANVNRVLRSIAGHLLAQKIEAFRTNVLRDVLSTFFLDPTAVLPTDWHAYAWIYPYKPQVVIDGAVIAHVSDYKAPTFFGEMKFYPLAVLFSEGPFHLSGYSATQLDNLLTSNINDTVSLNLSITGLPPQPWPEAPVNPGSAILHGDGSNYAVPR